mgnify:CR=1 FL=1
MKKIGLGRKIWKMVEKMVPTLDIIDQKVKEELQSIQSLKLRQ